MRRLIELLLDVVDSEYAADVALGQAAVLREVPELAATLQDMVTGAYLCSSTSIKQWPRPTIEPLSPLQTGDGAAAGGRSSSSTNNTSSFRPADPSNGIPPGGGLFGGRPGGGGGGGIFRHHLGRRELRRRWRALLGRHL